MAVDFNILARVPTIGSQIMAGQEAGREAAARNMLLQQRALEFQQAQEDRQRRLREEQIFNQAAEMIRQSGLDPEDPKVLQQFTAAAVQSRNPQLMSLATSMSERLAKRRQEQKNAAAVAAIAARRRGEAPAGAPAPAEAAPMLEAPAAVAAPVLEAPPPEVSPVARAQAEQPRPYFYGQGTFAGGGPAAIAAPVGAGIEPVRTDLPAQDMYADLAAANKLAPPAPVVNRMMAAPAPAPAVQVAGPAAKPAAPKVDVDKLQKQLDDLQEDYDEYSGLGTEEGRKAAAALKPQMGRLERQIRDASKTKERESPLMRDVVAFGFEPTPDGLAKFEAAKRDPDTVGTKEYNLAVKQGFKGSLFDYKKQLAEATRSVTNVSMSTEKKYGEQFAGEVAKSDQALWNAAQDAPAQAENANRILSTLATGKAITGPLADVKLNIARALNVVGVDNADTISKTEALVTSMAENTLNAIKTSGLGTGQGFTDKDLKFLQEAKSGNINFQPDTIRQLAELAHRAAEKTAEKWSGRVKQIPKSVLEGTGVSTEPITVPKRASSVTAGARPSGVGPDWTLMTDAAGNKAWVSPDRKQIKEVR